MAAERTFGQIPGTYQNQLFSDRRELAKSGIHRPTQAGISGSATEGADSIVLSGGYEDDEDFGNEIIYTGAGGRDPNTGQQIAHQVLERVNLALAKNKIEGLPVRVTRGYNHHSEYSPETGYQYSGLYYVDDFWREKGQSGFYVWRYRLLSGEFADPYSGQDVGKDQDHQRPNRIETTIQRVVRDTAVAKRVKHWHEFRCQVCGLTIQTGAGLYAEAAHIMPLGSPHNGPDVESNILCLCPNHHVMFDNGSLAIADDLSLIGIEGQLSVINRHRLDLKFIRYHREHYMK